jgi:polysaccharide pyruvyl transferase WcaK-like protein
VYSRSNSGDGLLVDLTLDRLARCGVGRDDVLLVALDPDSFPEVLHRAGIGTRGRGLAWELVPAAGRATALLASVAARRPLGSLANELATCDALVAVGGGYLRAADVTSSIGAALNHLPQLAAAARSRVPTLYLPQSVGPLKGPVGAALRRGLARVGAVCVRDEWSFRDLDGLDGVHRMPDLAVLDMAERADAIERVPRGRRIGFVARQLAHAEGYEQVVSSVADGLGDQAVWAVQTAGDRTKSDAVYYERLGVSAGGGLIELLAAQELSVVVSVRLHGALMAIAAGVPAVHLAYDRKGPGAFADLGLDEWCLDVRRVDTEGLRAVVGKLAADAEPYWERFDANAGVLVDSSRRLDDLVGAAVRA